VPWPKRYEAMRETIDAMRQVWSGDGAVGYDGKWVKFDPTFSYPKTVKPSGPPILMGAQGPIGLKHVFEYADEWCPRDVRFADAGGSVPEGIRAFRDAVSAAGRDPETIPITMITLSRPSAEALETYADMGVHRVVLFAPDTPDRHHAFLDRNQHFVEEFGARS